MDGGLNSCYLPAESLLVVLEMVGMEGQCSWIMLFCCETEKLNTAWALSGVLSTSQMFE